MHDLSTTSDTRRQRLPTQSPEGVTKVVEDKKEEGGENKVEDEVEHQVLHLVLLCKWHP